MTFLAPWAAWFLAGVPIIVLLYLLKVRRHPLPVSTLMFWQRVLQENQRRALFQRLRHWLSLLLHLLIFLLILAALAKPTLDAFLADGSATVLIVDSRARMQALEEKGETRFEKARRLALPFAAQASSRNPVALILAAGAPSVVVPFTDDEKSLRTALASAQASDAGGELTASIALAKTLLSARKGQHRIVLVSDVPRPEITAAAASLPVTFLYTGAPQDNVAISRFATRPLLNSPQTSEVLLEVRNFGKTQAKGNVEITLDGRRIDIQPYDLAPGARKLSFFPIAPPPYRNARGWLRAQLDSPDALPMDNSAFALLPVARLPRVLLVTKENWFLEKLLAADPQIRFELLEPDSFTLPMATKFEAVVFDNVLPKDFALGQTAGNFLFFKQTPFSNAQTPPLEQPLVTESDAHHPILRLVNLANLTIARAAAIALPTGDAATGWNFTAPLRAFDAPLLIAGERRLASGGEQRIAALAFDPAESDLPLRIAFPLLMTNSVQWLVGDAAALPRTLRTGESLALDPGQAVWSEPQSDPDAPIKPAPAQLTHAFFQPERQGFYLFSAPAADPAWIAVNTFSEAESDLRAAPDLPSAAAPVSPVSSGHFWQGARPLWQWLVITALLLSSLEWMLFHRRRTE